MTPLLCCIHSRWLGAVPGLKPCHFFFMGSQVKADYRCINKKGQPELPFS